MIGKTEATILYMVSEGVSDKEELKSLLPISGNEVDRIVKWLEDEGYLENSNGLKLTKKGFDVFMQKEVVEMVSEIRKNLEKLADDGLSKTELELDTAISEEEVIKRVAEAKSFLQKLADEGDVGKTEIVILYLISEGVTHSVDLKTLLPISSRDMERVLEELESKGYIENLEGLKLTKRGFDVLLEHSGEISDYVEEYLKRKVQKVNEVRRLIEKLTSEKVEVKDGIRYYLTPEEDILASCKDKVSGYQFYATTKRILKYKATVKGEDLAEIPYSGIDGIALSTSRDSRFIFAGLAIIACGFLFGFLVLGALLGIAAIGLYFYRSSVFYEFVGSELENKKTAKKWRIMDVDSMEVREFVRAVREEISKRKLKENG